MSYKHWDFAAAASPHYLTPAPDTAQDVNRMQEACFEEARRMGFSEGYGKGFADAECKVMRQSAQRVDAMLDVVVDAREDAQKKADALDCYDTDLVRMSHKYHAAQLKKIAEQLRKL